MDSSSTKKLIQLIDRANFGRYSTNRYVAQAAARLPALAKPDDLTAMYRFAMLKWYGWGLSQNREQALQLLKTAAEAGSINAAFNLGVAYDNGKGVSKSYYLAFHYHSKAALLGCIESMHCVGSFYYWGQGVEQDYMKAKRWYKKSAQKGYADGMCDTGRCYQRGVGGQKSHRWAVHWFTKAIAAGSTRAQTWLGLAYTCKPYENWGKARYWLEQASENQEQHAMYILGIWAEEGWNGPQNLADALFWFRHAAQLGHERAALRVASLHGEEF